jgi:hypothetical protein
MRRTEPGRYGLFMVIAVLLMLGSGPVAGGSNVDLNALQRSGQVSTTTSPSTTPTSAPRARPERVVSRAGSLHDHVTRHIASAARRDSEAYVVPSRAEARSLAAAAQHAEAERLEEAARLLEPLGFQVVRLTTPERRRYVLLEESDGPDGTLARHWGLYVLDPNFGTNLLVEVAHPLHDIDSHRVGVELFEAVRGRALLVAGAHRHANADAGADVAHTSGSVFESAHAALLRPGTVVIQPHGFARERHPELGDIVISGGVSSPPPLVTTLAESLRPTADVCIHERDRFRALAGTANVQGHSTRAAGATFVHVELARPLRSDDGPRRSVVRTMARLLDDSSRDGFPFGQRPARCVEP